MLMETLFYKHVFEYRVEDMLGLSVNQKIDVMNRLGKDGWEFSHIEQGNSKPTKYVFKRTLVISNKN